MTPTTARRGPAGFEERLLPMLVEALEERRQLPVGRPARPKSARRRWALAIGVVAGAAALALVAPTLLPGGPTGANPAAASMLRQVARRAAAQPAEPALGPGQCLYTRTQSVQTSTYVVGNGGQNFQFIQPLTRELWVATDGSGRTLEKSGLVTFPTPDDEAAWIAAGSPDLSEGQVTDDTYGPGELLYQDYSDLPTDPGELKTVIEERVIVGGPDGDWETFSIVGDLLRETYTQPAVRGALYEVAADLPGVELVGRVEDAAGRPGVAVAYTHEGIRQEFIFDPQTAVLLGERYVLVDASTVDVESGGPGAIYGLVGPAGTVGYEATYFDPGIVDSLSERPS